MSDPKQVQHPSCEFQQSKHILCCRLLHCLAFKQNGKWIVLSQKWRRYRKQN